MADQYDAAMLQSVETLGDPCANSRCQILGGRVGGAMVRKVPKTQPQNVRHLCWIRNVVLEILRVHAFGIEVRPIGIFVTLRVQERASDFPKRFWSASTM